MTGPDACESDRVCLLLHWASQLQNRAPSYRGRPGKRGRKRCQAPICKKPSYFPGCSGIEAKMMTSSALTAPLGAKGLRQGLG